MADLDQIRDRFAAHPLGRRVRRKKLGVRGLEVAQLVEQSVVLIVGDLGIVEDVVAIVVVLEELAELGRARGRRHPSTSLAAGAISRARS